MSENEKPYTLKKVSAELKKIKSSKEKKKEKIKTLTEEVKADNARIKELEQLYDKLYHEDLQRQIAEVWFKEQKMTAGQIQKFLELSRQIHDKIDILDVNMVVQAVTTICHVQQEGNADTSSISLNDSTTERRNDEIEQDVGIGIESSEKLSD